jgi:tetratricopeptide (TPR) repeat protein
MSWLRRAVSAEKADPDARRPAETGHDAFPAPRQPSAMDARPAESTNDQVVAGPIPHEPPGFRPRPDLLAALDRAGSVVRVLTGPPGAGKTQLAGAYARDRLAEGWRLVAWVNAGDSESLLAGQATLAEAVGLSARGALDAAGAGQAVRHRLETDGDRCLIVFDNVGDPDALRPFLPAAGSARVLITSDRPSAADLGASVPVGPFSRDEALTFLAGRTGLAAADGPAAEGAAAVAAELGYLPLALAQAAAVIAARQLSYPAYLAALRALPAKQYPVEGQARAILLSLDEIRADDTSGVSTRVMEIMAVLSAGVRRDLLHAAGQMGALGSGRQRLAAELVDRALVQLAERSLLTFGLPGQTAGVHPVVMGLIRARLARRGRLAEVCRAAAFALDTYAAVVARSPDRLAVRDVPEQVAALLSHMDMSAAKADHELAELMLRVRFWALHCLNRLGDSTQQAIAVGEPLIADFQQLLGFAHPDTLNARNSLAIAYQDAGRVADAAALHEHTLAAFERMHGRSHPSTLASRNNLAEAYRAAGRTAEAVELHEQALAGYERVRGPDHPDTLISRSHLAEAYRAAGRTAEAVELHERTVAGYERAEGADHPDTLTARSYLARAYQAAGRTAEAVSLLEGIVAARARVLGPEHPSTLGSRNNLANAYRAAGRTAEAIALHEQVLAVRQRVFGPDHPDTRQSQHNLARAYRDAGRAG